MGRVTSLVFFPSFLLARQKQKAHRSLRTLVVHQHQGIPACFACSGSARFGSACGGSWGSKIFTETPRIRRVSLVLLALVSFFDTWYPWLGCRKRARDEDFMTCSANVWDEVVGNRGSLKPNCSSEGRSQVHSPIQTSNCPRKPLQSRRNLPQKSR